MAKPRRRKTHKFQLTVSKWEDHELDLHLTSLKKSRQYVPSIRDSLTLLFSLQEGRLDVLQAMFPDAIEIIKQEGAQEERDQGQNKIEAKISELQTAINTVKQLSIVSGGEPKSLPFSKTVSQDGPRPMSIPTIDLPILEDDDDETVFLEIKKSSSKDSVDNFRRALMGLTQ